MHFRNGKTKLSSTFMDLAFILFFLCLLSVRTWFTNVTKDLKRQQAHNSKVAGVPHKTAGLFMSSQNKLSSLVMIRTSACLKAN